MKTILTENEINKLFYQRIDNISVRTKHKTKNGNYGKELKNGFLHYNSRLVGICHKDIPFVIRLVPTNEYQYYPLGKSKNRKYHGEIEYDEYIISQDAIEGSIITVSDILKTLWNGVNISLTVHRFCYTEYAYNKKFALCNYNRNCYNNARKGWKSALKDILSICNTLGINSDEIIKRSWYKGYWWVEYEGFKRKHRHLTEPTYLADNIRRVPTKQESITISGKIIYWENVRQKPILKSYYPSYESFKRAWSNSTGRKFIKAILKRKQEEFYKSLAEKQEYKERLLKTGLAQYIEDFKIYRVKEIPYKFRNVGDYAIARLSDNGNLIELWNGFLVTKDKWIAMSQFVTDCSASNIQLSYKTCLKYKIIVGSHRVTSLEANDLWNIQWCGCRFNLFEITRICRLIGYSLIACKITRKKLLSQFERN